jgi:hypothetical protein
MRTGPRFAPVGASGETEKAARFMMKFKRVRLYTKEEGGPPLDAQAATPRGFIGAQKCNAGLMRVVDGGEQMFPIVSYIAYES